MVVYLYTSLGKQFCFCWWFLFSFNPFIGALRYTFAAYYMWACLIILVSPKSPNKHHLPCMSGEPLNLFEMDYVWGFGGGRRQHVWTFENGLPSHSATNKWWTWPRFSQEARRATMTFTPSNFADHGRGREVDKSDGCHWFVAPWKFKITP